VSGLALASNFTALDWVIVAAYLLGTVAIGVYANRYIASMSDYVVAGRSLKTFIAIATMTGTELGLVTVMYSAQKGFTGGFAAFHIGLVAGIVTLIVGLTGFIVVPLRRMGVMTIPEFYGRRFGPGVRIYGAILLAAAGILNMGMFLKAGAIFLTGLTGLTEPVYVNVVMTSLILLVLAYTILGGMVSVVITDYVQFVVLSFGMLAACGFAMHHLGWEKIVGAVDAVHGAAGFNPFHGGGFGPSYVVWMIFTAGLVSCAVWQTAVMRACAAENERVVRRLYVWSSLGFMIRFMLPQFLGICALAWLLNAPPEIRGTYFAADGTISADAETSMGAFPIFLSQILPVGLIGLVGAGMLAAFMSTHDSYLLCWASVLVEDVAGPLAGRPLSTKTRLTLARVTILLIGLFLLVWSLWYPLGQDLWDYMAVSGAIYFTGAAVLLVLGIYWKRASRTGAYLALTAGMLSVLGLKPVKAAFGLGALEKAWEIEITSAHIGLIATATALVLMILGSLFFPDHDAKVEMPPSENVS
jgi:SSS family solute:Na+ symporter